MSKMPRPVRKPPYKPTGALPKCDTYDFQFSDGPKRARILDEFEPRWPAEWLAMHEVSARNV